MPRPHLFPTRLFEMLLTLILTLLTMSNIRGLGGWKIVMVNMMIKMSFHYDDLEDLDNAS